MQIQITVKDNTSLDLFIFGYMPTYIYREFINRLNSERLAIFDSAFRINSFELLKYALKNLLITRVKDNTYIIKIDKTLTYRNKPIMSYINLITYGTRDIRGYSIILDIFRDVTNNMASIYDAWQLGIR